jgi:hypothetical protein
MAGFARHDQGMQQWWIPARDAYDTIAKETHSETCFAICSRAAEGLVQARAGLLVTEKGRFESAIIPTQFWWAKGHAALEQNWEAGDFSTWINQTYEWKAFGVEFDFLGLKQMLSPQIGAEAARRLSVVGNPEWVSARGARQFAWEKFGANPVAAGDAVLQHVKLGFVPSRAVLMQKATKSSSDWDLEEREWNIPDWFWEDFAEQGSSTQDWASGKFSGSGRTPQGRLYITLTGVHFSLSALRDLASPTSDAIETQSSQKKGGRPPKDWWDDLWCAIWGDIYRGDLKPKSQADIERAMMDWVTARDESASESTLKPLARKMFIELQR